MRSFLFLVLGCLVLAPALLAQELEADLEVASLIIDKTSLATGEPFSFTARIRNNGPTVARDLIIQLTGASGLLPLSLDAPRHWTCRRRVSDSPGGTCTAPALGIGHEAEIRGTLLAPRNVASWAMTVDIFVTSRNTEPNLADNRRTDRFTHTAAASFSDLGAIVRPRGGAREGTRATVDVTVANNGPAPATNVHVAVDTGSPDPPLTDPTAEGNGWTCTSSLQGVLCRIASLAPGERSTFAVHFTAPQQEALIGIFALPQAEMNIDTAFRNDVGRGDAGIGSPESWRRILLPLAAQFAAGANGARWRTLTTMLIRSPEDLDIRPGPCDRIVDPCFPLELQIPFDASPLIYTQRRGGQFLYVRPEHESKLHFNTRIYDEARMTQTAGAEIPVVREHELRTSTISLPGIPVAPQYRHTLRVYDADARENTRVLIHMYAGEEPAPRVSVVRSLARSSEMFHVTSALLPTHPSYLELDPRELLPLEGLQIIRIDVEPVDPGLRFWAFVSITNNETHHVTTVTPQ